MLPCNGEADHIHLLVDMAPDISVSKLVNILKTISSREIRREFADHVNQFYWKTAFWTSAYCAMSREFWDRESAPKSLIAGGAPLDVIKKYIQTQNEVEPENPVHR